MSQHRWSLRTFALVGTVLFAACGDGSRAGERGDDVADRGAQAVHRGEATFNGLCAACHTIGGGDRSGPDLAGVHERRERDWLVRWIDDPAGMAVDDPLGRQILAEWKDVLMPDFGLTREQIEDVLDYIEAMTGS